MTLTNLLGTAHLRTIALALASVLVVGSTTAFVATAQITEDERVAAEIAAAAALEQKYVDYYTGALERLQPMGAQIANDAATWAGSGSLLLSEVDSAALVDVTQSVVTSMARTPDTGADSAALEKLWNSQWLMIQGAGERFDYVLSVAIAAAQKQLDAATLADSASRQTVTDSIAALKKAQADGTSLAEPFTSLTAAVVAANTSHAEAVAAAEAAAAAAAAAAARRGGGKRLPVSSCGENLASYVSDVLTRVNDYRTAEGLTALSASSSLNATAQAHATCMAINNNFAHSSYPVAENIAKGYPSASSVVDAWMNSSGHRANIMNPSYRYMGLGYVASGNWWCQQFSR